MFFHMTIFIKRLKDYDVFKQIAGCLYHTVSLVPSVFFFIISFVTFDINKTFDKRKSPGMAQKQASKESAPKSCVSFFVLGSEDSTAAFSVTEAVSSVNEEASSVIEAAFLISEAASSVSLQQVFIKGVNVNYSGFH